LTIGNFAPSAVPQQLAENGVFWSLDDKGLPGWANHDSTPARKLCLVVRLIGAPEEIDLRDSRQIERVRGTCRSYRVAKHVEVDFEVDPKSISERAEATERQVDDEVDVVRRARFSL
jgi:hypothetical protein